MHETIMLLQGPIRPFFRWLKKEFEQAGYRVFKVNFNGGDQLFYSSGISYRHCHNSFRDYIRNFMKSAGVTQVYLYGDCRPLHRTAVEVANELCIPVRVFEESLRRLEATYLGASSSIAEESAIRIQEAELINEFVKRARQVEPNGRLVVASEGKLVDIRLQDKDVITLPPRTDAILVMPKVEIKSLQVAATVT